MGFGTAVPEALDAPRKTAFNARCRGPGTVIAFVPVSERTRNSAR